MPWMPAANKIWDWHAVTVTQVQSTCDPTTSEGHCTARLWVSTIGCEIFVRIPERTRLVQIQPHCKQIGGCHPPNWIQPVRTSCFYFRKAIFTQVHFNHGLGMEPCTLPLAMQNHVLRPTLPIITPHCSWYTRRKRYPRCLGLCSMKTFYSLRECKRLIQPLGNPLSILKGISEFAGTMPMFTDLGSDGDKQFFLKRSIT